MPYFRNIINCTPIINLFDHFSEYITLDHSRLEYKVTPQPLGSEALLDIYDITEVWHINADGRSTRLMPSNQFDHRRPQENLCWSVRRFRQEIYLLFTGYNSVSDAELNYIKVKLLCSHKTIDSSLLNIDTEWDSDHSAITDIVLLKKIFGPIEPKTIKNPWQVIAYLSTSTRQMLNSASYFEVLKKILKLSLTRNQSFQDKILKSLLSLNITQENHLISNTKHCIYHKGLTMKIVVDEDCISFSHAFIFWMVLTTFFGIKYSLCMPIAFSITATPSNKKASCFLSCVS
jgi:type VI secretion system protein ImpG